MKILCITGYGQGQLYTVLVLSDNPGYLTVLKQYITGLVHIQLYTESSSAAVPMSIRKPRFVCRDVFFRVNTRVYVVYTPYTTPPAIFSDFSLRNRVKFTIFSIQ
jgi:hypothetical protein